MASIIIERVAPSLTWARAFPLRLAAIAALGLLLAGLFPLGYVGGGADDGRYLEAIRCIGSEGYCPPANHWAARLPLVLPAAAAVQLLGESRGVLLIVPLVYGIGSLILFALLVRRVASGRAALIASLALLGTPIFIARWPRLNVDVAEFFFLLASLMLLLTGIRRSRLGLVVLAGVAIGLAVLSRTTAIAAAPIIVAGLVLFTPKPTKWTALLASGGGITLAAEAALHWATAGRPLLSWELAHAHTRVPSTSLPPTVDLSRSPILNADYIANWARPAGIEVHWLLDGALNLLADPLISLVLLASLLLTIGHSIANRKAAAPTSAEARLGWFLAGAAATYFCILTFVLAVHPTARMFLPIASIAAFAIGKWADARREPLDRVLLAAILLVALVVTAGAGVRTPHFPSYQEEAERWVRSSRESLAISRTASSVFALSPSLSNLPVAAADGRHSVIAIGPGCAGVASPRLLRRFVHEPHRQIRYDLARRVGLTPERPVLCLISPPDTSASPSRWAVSSAVAD
jgi:4-amino-4-deoxy-L-arabinose transferase-like glycosyltransferase